MKKIRKRSTGEIIGEKVITLDDIYDAIVKVAKKLNLDTKDLEEDEVD